MLPTNLLAAQGLRGPGACALAGSGHGTADVFTVSWDALIAMRKTPAPQPLGSDPMY